MYFDTIDCPSDGKLNKEVENTDYYKLAKLIFSLEGRNTHTATQESGMYIIVRRAIDFIWILSVLVSIAIILLTLAIFVLVVESFWAI